MMRRILAILLCAALVLTTGAVAVANDNVYRVLYSGEVTTLNYLTTGTTNEFSLASNLIDTLVEYDKYGRVQPSLAESWEVSEDGLTWTFHLREGVKWVDGNGEAVADVTANDFVAAAKYVLDAKNAASTANIFYGVVEGAKAYYDGTAEPEPAEEGEEAPEPAPEMPWETVGVKAVDDLTLQYTLTHPVPYFLSMITYVCFMPVYEPFLREKGDQFGVATGNDTLLYNGAYYLAEFKPQESRVIRKNALGWDAENVFIEEVQYIFNMEASTVSPELYLRGEVDEASIDSAIASEWLADPEKAEYIHPVRQTGFYTYFYAFNFDPLFDAEYEPENWKLAVNNENFRKAIYHGLDRLKAMLITDPDNPEPLIYNTVTPPEFVNNNGLDFVDTGALAEITALGLDTFNEEKALEYRDLAKAELEAAGATFPIKVLMPYNPQVGGWDEESQIVEQQLEELLGTDFIDIIVEAGPSTGFLTEVRRAGKYALHKCNWGPDYADPQTYIDPFLKEDSNYNFIWMATQTDEEGNNITDKYYELTAAAVAITGDIAARYEAFAEAEAYLIEHAFIVPFGYGSGGYTGSLLNPFDAQYAPFGISNYRFKGQTKLDDPMNTDEYFEAYDLWLEERAALSE